MDILNGQRCRTKYIRNVNTGRRPCNARVDDLSQRLLIERQRIAAGYAEALCNR